MMLNANLHKARAEDKPIHTVSHLLNDHDGHDLLDVNARDFWVEISSLVVLYPYSHIASYVHA